MAVRLRGITLPGPLVYPKIDTFKLFDVMGQAPITAGLTGSYFLGKKNADPTYNFANPSKPLILNLSPDFSDPRFALMNANRGFFDTQMAPSALQTFVAIIKVPTASGALLSNYFKDTSGGISGDSAIPAISGSAASMRYFAQATATGLNSATRAMEQAIGSFAVVGGIIAANPAVGAWTMNDTSDPAFSTTTMTGRVVNPRTLRIGATYSNSEFVADLGVAALVLYNTDIGATPMRTMMGWMRDTVGVQAGIWSSPRA